MVHFNTLLSTAALAFSGVVSAHPGEAHNHEHVKREIKARDSYADVAKRSLDTCAGSLSARQMGSRDAERRANKVRELRKKRGITTPARKYRRDLAELEAWEDVNHNQTGSVSYDAWTPHTEVFAANASCILAPEVTDGPYYVVGEFMRSNVIEEEWCDGVPLFLEVQYVDIATCEPVPSAAVDIWNANATGVYSGIDVTGNVAADGVNSTYLRGIQLTDHDGVVTFETIFPGHYDDRATHTHLLTHTNATVQANGTISVWGKPVAHIGQLFWPEALRSAVEAVTPYSTNTQSVTSNDDDMWSIVQASASYDPFPNFLYLGDDIQDGIFAWIKIGLNASADYQTDDYYAIAGYLDESGGHSSSSTGSAGGGGGEGGGNMTSPGNTTSTANFTSIA